MSSSKCSVIAVTNQKGGVGKTTTAMNLACALGYAGRRVLVIDCDPHGNLTQGLGIAVQELRVSISDLIKDRGIEAARAIQPNKNGIDVIGSNPLLAQVSRWMVTQTNAELRLKQRLVELRPLYEFILIDSCPGLGTLLNSTLNASDYLIIPVDPGFYGYMGMQELRNEIEEIRAGTNPRLAVLGVLATLSERTVIARETRDALIAQFGELVFETTIRRCVALRESPAMGQSVFHYAPRSNGAEDYAALALETIKRLGKDQQPEMLQVAHA